MGNQTKYYFIVAVMLLSCAVAIAQTDRFPYSAHNYYYIQYDSSRLEHFGDNKNINVFYDKLDKLCFEGDGQISILQIGGSHIQAGMWSWELRTLFENLTPGMEGAPGIVFPFSIAKTNHPYFYTSSSNGNWEISKFTDKELSQPVGATGIVAYTYDSLADITIKFNKVAKIENHKFSKISLFHDVADTSYTISVMPNEHLDSVVLNAEIGASVFYFNQTMDSLKFIVQKIDTSSNPFKFYGAFLQNTSPGINYVGLGINGASTFSYLKAEYFQQHVKAINPDLAILSIGVNDASGPDFSSERYISNYRQIINKILEVNPKCAIIFTTNNDFYYRRGGVNPHFNKIYQSLTDLSKIYGASVWNLFSVMGGYKSINLWKNDNLAQNDRIHFTREGYKIVAGLLFDAILKDYELHLRQSLIKTTN
jgi:lysophospholipase L1-like esterase